MEKILQPRTLVCRTVKSKAVAALLAVIAAVCLPQVFHLFGMLSGTGSSLGEILLPMHIPVFLIAFFAGAWAGFSVGFSAPILSFLLTYAVGTPMPAAPVLPYMVIELSVYGIAAGLLKTYAPKLPCFLSLLISQVMGRGARALALLVGVYGLNSPVMLSSVWTSVLTGLAGILLQWALVPLLVCLAERRRD